MKPVAHLAQRLTCATQEMLAAICHCSKSPGLSSNSLCHIVTLLAKSCKAAASCIFQSLFNCKEQNLVTEENIPCLFIDS